MFLFPYLCSSDQSLLLFKFKNFVLEIMFYIHDFKIFAIVKRWLIRIEKSKNYANKLEITNV